VGTGGSIIRKSSKVWVTKDIICLGIYGEVGVFRCFLSLSGRWKQILDVFEQIIFIYQWLADQPFRLREIIHLLDTEKLRYFVITDFNNCFTKFFHTKITPRAQKSDLPFSTQLCTRRLICGQPFTGYARSGRSANEKEELIPELVIALSG